jgi:acetyl esterase/lipase
VPVTVGHCAAEWVLAEGSASRGRILYLHGGGFTAGSPRSHRRITTELARRTGLAVLALDYRLMPEHSRRDMLEDSRNAYRWLLEHGPEGPGPAEAVFVAGDSAGGNLTLALIAWIRDQGLRQANGAIALSPLTDATFASPSLARNVDSDPMLGPMARLIGRVPRPLMLWSTWLQNRIRPADPQLSPLRGDLAGLPPVLIQASDAEILIDDARRYVNRAREAGSPAELEIWRGMVHVWPAFGPELPETKEAFERMARFVERVLEGRARADAA